MPFLLLWQILRPKHWIKNSVVFAALLFSLNGTNTALIGRAVFAFAVFCAVSSCVYILNDLFDRNRDREHPSKSQRPIASGAVTTALALFTACILLAAALTVSFLFLSPAFAAIISIYFALQLSYSAFLKHIVILDVMLIAFGFVLRALAGAIAIDVAFSHWLLSATLLLSLFLGFGKRRHELTLLEDEAGDHRSVLTDYSPYLLDQMIGVVTAATLIVYILYTTSNEVVSRLDSDRLVYTTPFVLYGLFRYLFLIHRKDGGGDPTTQLLTDRPLILCILLWVASVTIILYRT